MVAWNLRFFTLRLHLRLRCPGSHVCGSEMQTQAQMEVQENENVPFLTSALAFAFALR